MNCSMNDHKAWAINRILRGFDWIAVVVDLHQILSRDLGVHQTVGVQKILVVLAGNTRSDVGIDEIAHAGWAVRLSDGAVKVGMVHPKVKDKRGLAGVGYAGVVKGTKNKAAAEFYINVLISDEMQELLHVKNGIVPPNRDIQEKYSDPSKLKRDANGTPFLLMKPSEIDNLYQIDWSNFNMKDWTRKWNRQVAK